jgi:branched-chain amino acid transport system substrate-binding protein
MKRPVLALSTDFATAFATAFATTSRRFALNTIAGVVAASWLLSSPLTALAQADADMIIIGQSVSLTGPYDEIGLGLKAGIEAHFEAVNQAGGINGKKLKLVSLDDASDPARAKANVKKLIEDNALALIGLAGSHNINPLIVDITAAKIPLVGPSTGDIGLRSPSNRYIFNTRASYVDEMRKVVATLVPRGLKKIALFAQSDASGRAGLAGLAEALDKQKLRMHLYGTVDRNSVNVSSQAASIAASKPDAVVIVAGGQTAAAFIREMKRLGSNAKFTVASSAGASTLAKLLGPEGAGVEVSQIVPLPYSSAEPLGREYLKRIGGEKVASFSSYEGYISARILVEGMKKAGRVLNRETLVDALDRSGTIDLSGFKVSYSPTNHVGTDFVELTVLGSNGTYKR